MPQAQEKTEQRSRHAARYIAIARSGSYNDDPCKIETNARGEVVKEPPPTPRHKWFQKQIEKLLDRELPGGEAVTEFPVHTREGTKLPDVAWFTTEAWSEFVVNDMSIAIPRICVEVLSPSNSTAEMAEKREVYFDIGVEEVWICDQDGTLRFYDANGQMEASRAVESAPDRISTDFGA